jgi:cell cycle checkpoint protein
MASRPAKRQRTSRRVLSDDDDDSHTELPLRTPKAQRQLSLETGNGAITLSPTSERTQSLQSTPKKQFKSVPRGSPTKARKSARLASEPDKSKSLHTFFGKVSDEQRWHRKKSNTPEIGLEVAEAADAIVDDDDISDDALLALENAPTQQSMSKQKTLRSADVRISSTSNNNSRSRFVKPAIPSSWPRPRAQSPSATIDQQDHRPWAERYGPSTLEELAIHKKKITDVQQWLDGSISGKLRQKLLVLKGPAGSGKTTTITLVAQALGLKATFWQNPGVVDVTTSGSVVTQFSDFLNRGGQYGSLAMDTDNSISSKTASQLLVVEEFPPSSTRSSANDSVRSALLQYLARAGSMSQPLWMNNSMEQTTCPVVLIISETLLSSSTAFSHSFTAHRLLGPEILNHPATTAIDFNPVAQTFIHKALDLVVRKEARDSLRRRIPGAAVMQHLADMGDVRNAVNALEFLCVRSDANSDWSGTVAKKPKKSTKDVAGLTEMERESLKLVSQRETTLDMFHAAGKVVYNKREDPRVLDSRAEPPPKPPDHLSHLYRSKISQVDIEALFNETGTDIQTFISSLHENYALSCNADSFTEHFDDCASVLSASDIINPDARRTLRSRVGTSASSLTSMQSGSTDALRQDEISFNVAARGLIFHLPHPVNRAAPSSGRNADKYKMFYPASLRMWKPTEEIDALISMFRHEDALNASAPAIASGGVASWKNVSLGRSYGPINGSVDEHTASRQVMPSHKDLVLDILPYLTHIKASRGEDTRSIRRITQIQNMSVPLTGEEPDEEEPKDEAIVRATKLTTTSVASIRSPMKSSQDFSKTAQRGSFSQKVAGLDRDNESRNEDAASTGMENLFLEEDDIIDD